MGYGERANPFGRHTMIRKPDDVFDARGRALQIGDGIIAVNSTPQYRVANIERVLDPKLPPNLVRLTLTATVQLVMPGGETLQDLFRVETGEEINQKRAEAGLKALPTGEGEQESKSADPPEKIVGGSNEGTDETPA